MTGVQVVALGGSLLRPEVMERHAWLEGMAAVVAEHVAGGGRLGLVIGGGQPAREAISLAQPLLDDVARLDELGIAATRLNAAVVQQILAGAGIDVAAAIPIDVEHAAELLEQHAVVVMGGTVPGHTTDAVAIRLAVSVGAGSCIIATNVSHVHSADPATDPDAVARERMTLSELQEIVGPPEHVAAGPTAVIDPIGVQVAIDAGLPLRVLDGRRLQQLAACIAGEAFEGTAVEVG